MDKSPSSSPGSSGSSTGNAAASGCGSSEIGTIQLSTPPPPPPPITLNITTTTGGSFTVLVDVHNTVENLKKIIAKKLKVAKDRICLLHRERELQVGTLKENGLLDGSKIILIPNVETGLLAQRPENTVMQALESLNDAQVNDFLSGKTPLNLSMRLGDHMMLIQLQLSTVNPSSPSHSSSRSRSTPRNTVSSKSHSTFPASSNNIQSNVTSQHAVHSNTSRHTNSSLGLDHLASTSSGIANSINSVEEMSSDPFPINHNNVEKIQGLPVSQLIPSTSSGNGIESSATDCCSLSSNTSSFTSESQLEQSPIKSLSNLVSSPMKTTPLANIPTIANYNTTDSNRSSNGNESPVNVGAGSSSIPLSCSDPISAKLTSCLCKRLLSGSSSSTAATSNTRNCDLTHCQTRQDVPVTPIMSPCGGLGNNGEVCSRKVLATSTPNHALKQSANSSFLHKTANNPILRSKHIRHHHHGHHNSHHHYSSSNVNGSVRKSSGVEKCRTISGESPPATTTENANSEPMYDVEDPMTAINATDSRALAEASRNLTQTLRKLSKEVFTSKVDLSDETPRKSGSGAVIESMKNHGKGIYSGTFSGTLNPALQDRFGRPKRDISTVIHILNDLLSATPQYSRGARICFESPSTSKSTAAKSKTCSANDGCNKCFNATKTNSCVYGECNGHYNSANISNIATTSSQTSCHHHNTATANDTCSCCGRDSGFSFETSQSLTRSECSSLVSNGSEISSLNTSLSSSSCSCSFLRNGLINTSDSNTNETSQDSDTTDKNICNKCIVEQENNKTKCKLDRLRLVMQQSKERREARKLKGAPYGARVLSTSTSATSSSNSGVPTAATSTNSSGPATTIAPLASPSEVSPNHIVEEVNTAA